MYWTCIKVGGQVLVDINLLPQKEKTKTWVVLSVIISLTVVAVLFTAAWFFYQSQTQAVDSLTKKLAANEQLRQIYESEGSEKIQSTPTDELERAVDWAAANRKETYALLQHLTSLLPERGFVTSFSFQTEGTISLSVQFDTTRQAADFLHHTQSSSYIKNSELLTISTDPLEEETDGEETGLPRYRANFQLELDLAALLASDQSEEVSP